MVVKMMLLVGLGATGVMSLGLLGGLGMPAMVDQARAALTHPETCGGAEACLAAMASAGHTYAGWIWGVALVEVLTLVPMFSLVTISIVSRVRRAEAAAHRIAALDLSQPVDVEGSDEMGRLRQSLAHMQQSLGGIVHGVRLATSELAVASNQIAAGNEDLSNRTESQAGNVQQAASNLSELTRAVQTSAANSAEATRLAGAALAVVDAGDEAMNHVVARMRSIGASAQKIADITGVIDGIAFQTNILALNAVVEAARAGESGRGFAVVATEVRALAQRSAQAVKEIKALIQDASDQVSSGTTLADDAGRRMAEIKQSVAQVSAIVNNISAAGADQTARILQIDGSVGALDNMTQSNAAMVEEIAESAKGLDRLAASLMNSMARFRLGDHHPA